MWSGDGLSRDIYISLAGFDALVHSLQPAIEDRHRRRSDEAKANLQHRARPVNKDSWCRWGLLSMVS